MKKIYFLVLAPILVISCGSKNTIPGTAEKSVSGDSLTTNISDTIEVPVGYKVKDEVSGDLDQDKIPEKVILYDTDRSTEFGLEREIRIYKQSQSGWKLWHTSIGAILSSEHGGMMGDPFSSMSIEKGCLVITHYGGSRYKWSYIHRYRFQNSTWKLIGVTTGFGAVCEYFEDFDYNLSTGKITYKKELESCNDNGDQIFGKTEEATYTKKTKVFPDMDGFHPGDNKIKLDSKHTLYY